MSFSLSLLFCMLDMQPVLRLAGPSDAYFSDVDPDFILGITLHGGRPYTQALSLIQVKIDACVREHTRCCLF
jgi:hypothetical protein